jgi:DNA repair protein RecN (Recombination protein N)
LCIDPEEDGTLIISREFNLAGKNTCRINGRIVTISMLKEIGELIIDIHGQYDNQSLLRTESHIKLLDLFGGEKIQGLKQNYINILSDYKNVRTRLKEISGDVGERERQIDLLKFQIDEITRAELKANEEENLNKQRLVLSNSEKIIGTLNSAYEILSSGNNIKSSACDNISEALSELNGIHKLGENLGELKKSLEDLSYQLEDITEEIRKERDNMEYNPEMLEDIEERIDLIFKLKRKYGNSINEILKYCINAKKKLQVLIDSEASINSLNIRLRALSDQLYKTACSLNAERRKAGEILENKITCELNDLEMKKAKFKVNIEFDDTKDLNIERKFSQNGLDKIEFLISPNIGEPLKPLSKIASGGEMSRIMLAIKTILANVDEIPTLIFDEIDIGVSGRAAQKVGEKLKFISKNHQVLCVTHIAQIASLADNHYLIEKHSNNESTQTRIHKLTGNDVRDEIARILGGSVISDITLKHAEEMLQNAK